MTEQVIDIRDRIEKMRTQMTGSSDTSNNLKKQRVENKNPPKNSIKIEKMENVEIVKTANEEKTQIPKNEINLLNKLETSKNENFKKEYNFSNMNTNTGTSNTKTYKDYQNENIVDDNKKNVRLDEDKPFPQFNLNVSNPISWKLMLLIMLMQLLTNIMLVVVLYLK
ncbi:hypothetical protein OAY92_02105 [Alphaproteobacteria bacterium]|nr:hypothetical protein [Alphaproteobacteria bacterium]